MKSRNKLKRRKRRKRKYKVTIDFYLAINGNFHGDCCNKVGSRFVISSKTGTKDDSSNHGWR